VAGLSALQLMVPAADPLLADLRPRLPAGATVLDPGHISFGYPWLQPDVAGSVIDDVAEALAAAQPADVVLHGPQRFPADTRGRITVHLVPEPRAALEALAAIIADASGHDIDSFTPHCSLVRLAAGVDPSPLEALVRPRLPVQTRLDTVALQVRTDAGWTTERTVRLGGRAG
jgi:2'-5' RNA ligase